MIRKIYITSLLFILLTTAIIPTIAKADTYCHHFSQYQIGYQDVDYKVDTVYGWGKMTNWQQYGNPPDYYELSCDYLKIIIRFQYNYNGDGDWTTFYYEQNYIHNYYETACGQEVEYFDLNNNCWYRVKCSYTVTIQGLTNDSCHEYSDPYYREN